MRLGLGLGKQPETEGIRRFYLELPARDPLKLKGIPVNLLEEEIANSVEEEEQQHTDPRKHRGKDLVRSWSNDTCYNQTRLHSWE